MTDLTWTNDTRTLRELCPYEDNPRTINEEQKERLRHSKEKFAQPWPIIIGPDNELYDGHQRLDTWGEEWGLDLVVDVRVASRALTDDERKEIVVLAHDGATGGWDKPALKGWAKQRDLLGWGMDEDLARDLPDYDDEKLPERSERLRPKEYFRVLISVPVDRAVDVREVCETLAAMDGAEVLYGAN